MLLFLANIQTLGDRFINCWRAFSIRMTEFVEAPFLTFNELQKKMSKPDLCTATAPYWDRQIVHGLKL